MYSDIFTQSSSLDLPGNSTIYIFYLSGFSNASLKNNSADFELSYFILDYIWFTDFKSLLIWI